MPFTLYLPNGPATIAPSALDLALSTTRPYRWAKLLRRERFVQSLSETRNIVLRPDSPSDPLKHLPHEPNFALTRFIDARPAPAPLLQRVVRGLRCQDHSGADKVHNVTCSEGDRRHWTRPRYLGDSQHLAVYVSSTTLAAKRVMDALTGEAYGLGQAECQFIDLLHEHETAIQEIANDHHYQDPRVRLEERVLHANAKSALTALRQRLGLDSTVTREALSNAEHYLRAAYQSLRPADALVPYTLPRLLDEGRIRQFALHTAHCCQAGIQAAALEEVQQVIQSCYALDKHVPRPPMAVQYEETHF
jgi:hypothetical protein